MFTIVWRGSDSPASINAGIKYVMQYSPTKGSEIEECDWMFTHSSQSPNVFTCPERIPSGNLPHESITVKEISIRKIYRSEWLSFKKSSRWSILLCIAQAASSLKMFSGFISVRLICWMNWEKWDTHVSLALLLKSLFFRLGIISLSFPVVWKSRIAFRTYGGITDLANNSAIDALVSESTSSWWSRNGTDPKTGEYLCR